jgi:predicted nucleic acid-binding protein
VIYIDSSVALARVFREPGAPSAPFWTEPLISSKLLEYEIWNRVHAYGLTASHSDEARMLLTGVELIELIEPVLARALEPFPVAVRTLDALHLATADFLRRSGERIELASFDNRLLGAARVLGMTITAL